MFIVKVLDENQNPIKGAFVTITSMIDLTPKEEEDFDLATYNKDSDTYEFKPLPLGRYLVKVQKEAYVTQEVFVAVDNLGLYQEIYLYPAAGRSPKFIISGNTKLPIIKKEFLAVDFYDQPIIDEVRKDFINFQNRASLRSKPLDEMNFDEIQLSADDKSPVSLLVEIDKFGSTNNRFIAQEFAKSSKVAKTRRVIYDHQDNQATVLDTLFVKFFDLVAEKDQDQFLKDQAVRVISQDSYTPNAYIIEYLKADESDIFDFAAQLLSTGLFEIAEPEMEAKK